MKERCKFKKGRKRNVKKKKKEGEENSKKEINEEWGKISLMI